MEEGKFQDDDAYEATEEELLLRALIDEDPELVDPEGEKFSERRRWSALLHFAMCWVFLITIHLAVFTAPFGTFLYHQTAAVSSPLTMTEPLPGTNTYLLDTANSDDMYSALKDLVLPTMYNVEYYSGKSIWETDRTFGAGWTSESLLTLGRIRLRQIRVKPSKQCRVASFVDTVYEDFENATATCYAAYSAKTELDDKIWALGSTEVEYKSYSDGNRWDSPYSKTWYGTGGYIVDLPLEQGAARGELEALQLLGYVDAQTRVIFVEVSFFNPNVGVFSAVRLAFEFLQTGKVRATLEADSAPLTYDKNAMDDTMRTRLNLICEVILYGLVVGFVLKVIEDVAKYGSMKAYVCDGWNCLEVASITFFVIAIILRLIYNFRVLFKSDVGSYEDNVKDNDEGATDVDYGYDKYIRVQLSFGVYRLYRSFFSLGVLTSFLKSLRLLTISRKLSLFTETVYRVSVEMIGMFVVLIIILVGFGIATHLSFGAALYEYRTVSAAIWTLTLVAFGSTDFDSVVAISPTAGLVVLVLYNIIITFVVVSMFIKIVDVSFVRVEAQLFAHDDSEYVREIRSALRHLRHDIYWRLKLEMTLLRVRIANTRRKLAYTTPTPYEPESEEEENAPVRAARNSMVITSTLNTIDLSLDKRRELLAEARRPFDEPVERRRIIGKMLREGKEVKDVDITETDLGASSVFFDSRQGELLELYEKIGSPPEVFSIKTLARRRMRAPLSKGETIHVQANADVK